MNSLTELNGYVNSLSFEYTDLRYTRVIFDRDSADNQTIIVNEGETFPLSIGIEIIDVVNYASANATMTVDISSAYANGVTVDWGTLPSGVTVTPDGSGVYVLEGINSSAIWDQIKQPNIVLPTNVPDAFYGNWTYTVTIDYYDANLGAQSQEYTVAVSVLNVTFMTTPIGFVYSPSSTDLITNTPQLASYLDGDYPGATWTITATVSSGLSIDSFSSTYSSGGTFTFNSGTKGFTIVGTRSQVNSHLQNLYIDSNNVEIDFIIYYVLSNNQDSTTDSKSQSMTNQSIQYFSNLTESTFYYTEDTQTEITGYPQITDTTYSGTGNYTVEIYASDDAYIYTMESEGSGGTTDFDSETKILTITGTKTQVNNHLLNISIQPESDVADTFQLFYELTTPLGAQSIKIMTMICGSNDTEVSNISVTRSYISNRGNTLFLTSIPQITDFDTTGTDTYTFTLQSSIGVFSDNDTSYSNPYSFTGTRSQVNAKYSLIKFYPNAGVSSNGTINYTQIKNGVTQISTSFGINGASGTYQNSRLVTITSTQTFTPTLEDVFYGKYAAYIVGGGGGGGYNGGGGGGGGEAIYISNQSFSLTTYTATVGVGGAGPNSSSSSSNYGRGQDGGNSTFASFTARGGKGGKPWAYDDTGTGGDSGNGNPGGSGLIENDRRYGGGGGGMGGGGSNASTSTPEGGNGGSDFWTYTDRTGTTYTNTSNYSGGGGGGGGYNSGGNGPSQGGGDGGDRNGAAENGDPRTGQIITPQYSGNGGGGGGWGVNATGGNGADGIIVLDIYY